MDLSQQPCTPCRGDTPPLPAQEAAALHAQLRDWALVESHHLEKDWRFADFAEALAFVNRAGAVCEAEGHHAEFELGWGRARARIWTHKINGLTASDFVLAAKLDRL